MTEATTRTYKPTLRPDLSYHEAEGDLPCRLHDPVLRRDVRLGSVARALCLRLAPGNLSVAELVEGVARECGVQKKKVERSLRYLLLMDLLQREDASDPKSLPKLSLAEAQERIWVLGETRFSCIGSGDCCQSYSYGPLSPGDLVKLNALAESGAIAQAFPELGPGPYVETREVEGGVEHYLATSGDSCIFHLPDRRCGIHAAFGADQKPGLCTHYPYRALPTLFGIKLFTNNECSCYSQTATKGRPIAERPEEQRQLLSSLLPGDPFAEPADIHPVIHLDPKTPCDYRYVVQLQDALCEMLEERLGTTAQTVWALAKFTQAYVDRLRGCPIAPNEPQKSLESLLSRSKKSYYRDQEPPDTTAFAELSTLSYSLLGGEKGETQVPAAFSFKNGRQCIRPLRALRTMAQHWAGEGSGPLPSPLGRLRSLTRVEGTLDEVARLSLRQQIFGARFLPSQRPLAGLLRIAYCYVFAMLCAKLRALETRSLQVSASHFDLGHMLSQRVLMQEECLEPFLTHERSLLPLVAAGITLVE